MLDAIKCVVDDNFVFFSGRQCCAKMAGPIKMTFGFQIPMGTGNFKGKKRQLVVKYSNSLS